MNSDLDRQHLKTGIIEFDPIFQKEWEDIAKLNSAYSLAEKNVKAKTDSSKIEFFKKLDRGSLSKSLIALVDSDIGLSNFGNEVERIHASIIENTQRLFNANLCPGLNSLELYRTICDTGSRHDYKLPSIYKSFNFVLVVAFLIVLMMLGIGIISNKTELLCLGPLIAIPGVIIERIYIRDKGFVVRRRGDKSDDTLIKKMSTCIASQLLQKDPQTLSSDEVFSLAKTKLGDIFWNKALELNVSAKSASSTLRDAHAILVSFSVEETGYADFKTQFEKIANQYQYMKRVIIMVGNEIYEGHRVPSRYKKTRIQLVRCPQCAGPLASEMDSQCPYCDSVFTRY